MAARPLLRTLGDMSRCNAYEYTVFHAILSFGTILASVVRVFSKLSLILTFDFESEILLPV